MIPRVGAAWLEHLASLYPVVSVTGPRQSGKTTLCRSTFPRLPYVSLEPLDVREFAARDPRGFLAAHREGAIIDEAQRVPELLSYLQPEVDERPAPGRFILTGSQNLPLTQSISQSLAGRVGILELYPPSWAELQRFPEAPRELLEVLWSGAYPRIYDRGIPPSQWLADYVATYVQRDVRQLLNVTDLQAFTAFLRLCAGATASEVHLSRLGADAGVSHNTARAWLSVLEASHLVFRLPAWHPNLRKRVVRSSKLHFVDTGLVCHLLGIRAPEELRTHPLRGAVFDTWVAAEVLKRGRHEGQTTELFHYRDSAGLEVDLVVGAGRSVILAEAKSGATIASDYPDSVRRLATAIERRDPQIGVASRVVYGGDERQTRGSTEIIPWRDVAKVSWQPAPAGGPSSSTT